jgi:hypothetical protein
MHLVRVLNLWVTFSALLWSCSAFAFDGQSVLLLGISNLQLSNRATEQQRAH